MSSSIPKIFSITLHFIVLRDSTWEVTVGTLKRQITWGDNKKTQRIVSLLSTSTQKPIDTTKCSCHVDSTTGEGHSPYADKGIKKKV